MFAPRQHFEQSNFTYPARRHIGDARDVGRGFVQRRTDKRKRILHFFALKKTRADHLVGISAAKQCSSMARD